MFNICLYMLFYTVFIIYLYVQLDANSYIKDKPLIHMQKIINHWKLWITWHIPVIPGLWKSPEKLHYFLMHHLNMNKSIIQHSLQLILSYMVHHEMTLKYFVDSDIKQILCPSSFLRWTFIIIIIFIEQLKFWSLYSI